MQAKAQFKNAMLDADIKPPADINPDGAIHRFGKNKNGWYVFYNDNIPAGSFGDWSKDLSISWCSKKDSDFSPEERSAYKKRMQEASGQREAEQQKRQAKAKKTCSDKWVNASSTINHEYLTKKQVKAYGLKQSGEFLLIPVRKNKQLTSLQTISTNSEKRFHSGGAIAGGYHVIGKPTDIILIGEGYATLASAHETTGFLCVVAFNTGNLKAVAQTVRKNFSDNKIIILADNDAWKDNNPGITKATEAAKGIGACIAIPQFKNTSTKPTDFNDLHCMEGLEIVKQQIESALNDKPKEITESPEQAIARLSKLSAIDYETIRESEAKKLSFRASVLDKEVNKQRKDLENDSDEVVIIDSAYQGNINSQQLLSEIQALISKHMVLPNGASPAITLWIVATYVYDAFRVFPKLAVISPEKRCGKSTMLDILSGLTCGSLLASNITPAAIFRSVDLWKPTLIIDEADTFLSGRNDDLIGVINSGHTKTTAFVVRTVGDDHTPKKFSTWSPMAFASIKGIAGTVMDRSIIINLRRRMAGEKVTRLSVDFRLENTLIREKLVKWGQDNFNQLKANPVEPPEIPNDRAIDNWLPLFTIAYAIGGEWPAKVESAYTILNSMDEEETASIMLLKDIKSIFTNKKWVKTFSLDLVNELVKLEERPWCEWKKGKPMTQNSLAKILKTFSISSKMIRIEKPGRGYEFNQFKDAFYRYIHDTPIQSVTTLQTNDSNDFSYIKSVTNNQNVTLQKQHKAIQANDCNTVTLQNDKKWKRDKSEEEF